MTAPASKPRLLILGHLLPWPLDSGVSVRAFNIWRRLADHFRLRVLCFTRKARQPDAAAVLDGLTNIREFAEADCYPLPWDGPYGRVVPHLQSLLWGKAYTRFEYSSRRFAGMVRDWGSASAADLIHVESLDLAAYISGITAPVAVTHHNVESLLLERRAARTRNPVLRRYLDLQARRLRADEQEWLPKVALNVAVSTADAEALATIGSGARIAVIPNGVDTSSIRPSASNDGPHLAFLGGLDWFPNRDALDFWVDLIEPELRCQLGAVTLRWVGAVDSSIRTSARFRGVQFTGFVRDPAEALAGVGCFVVPLRVGGGTRLKILEAWGLGLPVVSTSIGCEGLQARDGENILIADTPPAFAEAVARVLRNPDLRSRLGRGGRETAVHLYDWGQIVRDLAARYFELLESPQFR